MVERVNLVVCVKCWGQGINVGVWGITSKRKNFINFVYWNQKPKTITHYTKTIWILLFTQQKLLALNWKD